MAAKLEVTPPPLQGVPTSKEKRYDRQLRLWAASGQAALEEAHILLINNGPGVVGVETLKNLILPGIGHFTILDSTLVSEQDLGVNFFLDESTLGTFRAESSRRLLQELNPDVEGHAITEPLQAFVARDGALDPYSLVLVTAPITPDVLQIISTHCQTRAVPLFYIHCSGFYSHFSLALPPAFPIVDTHPDPVSTTDLRLLAPWPELVQFQKDKTSNLQALSPEDIGHVPYLLLLLHFLDEWRASHNGQPPQSYHEKTDFRNMVAKASPPDEENFAEATAAIIKSLNPPTAPGSVLAVLDAPEAKSLSPSSSAFWFIANAIRVFYSTHNQLPLPGAVPDMKARSADYIQLQNIYKSKARKDAAEVLQTVRSLEASVGRTDPIDEKEVEAFCKGAAHIKLVRGKPLRVTRGDSPLHWGKDVAKYAVEQLNNLTFGLDSGILHYIAFVAWDVFVGSHDVDGLGGEPRVPGSNDTDIDADTDKMVGIALKIIDSLIEEAGTFIENPGYDELKEKSTNIVREL
jgi:amyloid beta precursor protein binding protein 1